MRHEVVVEKLAYGLTAAMTICQKGMRKNEMDASSRQFSIKLLTVTGVDKRTYFYTCLKIFFKL